MFPISNYFARLSPATLEIANCGPGASGNGIEVIKSNCCAIKPSCGKSLNDVRPALVSTKKNPEMPANAPTPPIIIPSNGGGSAGVCPCGEEAAGVNRNGPPAYILTQLLPPPPKHKG